MNNNQHKLYNLEITPPETVWRNIVDELEDINKLRGISKKLDTVNVAPPAFLWDRIEAELEDEHLFGKIGQKLNSLEIAPPAVVWENIEETLFEIQPQPKVVQIQPRRKIMRYAAAAGIVGLLGFFSYQMMEKSNKTTEQMYSTFQEIQKRDSEIATQNQPAKSLDKIQSTKTEQVLASAQQGSDKATTTSATPVVKTASGTVYSTSKEQNKEIDGRYIVLMTDEGNVVRMSKKLGNIADCIAGENNTQTCDDQIQKWQQELASSTVSASPDNFLDILELANKESGL